MENKTSILEMLLNRTVDYTKGKYDLVRLKTVDKASDLVSSVISTILVYFLIASFLLFVFLGTAFWLGEMLGEIYYGFLAVAALYGLAAIILRLFFYKRLKKRIENQFIRKVLN